MKIITCISADAKKSAKRHSLLNRLEPLLYKIEEDQSVSLLECYADKRFLVKRFIISGCHYRAVFSRHIYKGYTALCLFQLSSHNKHYDVMWKKTYKKTEADHLFKQTGLENKLLFDQRIKQDRYTPPMPPLVKPNAIENLWLSCRAKQLKQVIVIETKQWINTIASKKFRLSHAVIHTVLQEVYAQIDDYRRQPQKIAAPFLNAGDAYYKETLSLRVHLQYFPQHNVLFLLALTPRDQTIPSLNPDTSFKSLTQGARRAYSLDAFVLTAKDFRKIQDKNEANLALSPEEVEILNHSSNHSNNRFPLFINGRAGSGKSTLLQYLLKDYLYLAIEHWDTKHPYTPLYLTYSKKLLDFAVKSSNQLLKHNASILLQKEENKPWRKKYKQHKEQLFSSTFKLFQAFMLELLPKEDQRNFLPQQYISYARFKELWAKKTPQNNLRHYDVDLVWHIIRTYIKGMSDGLGSYFTPQHYEALPKDYKTIENDDFEKIYSQIWEKWYLKHCKHSGEWDDQDLALTVLAKAEFPNHYPAIFCDEAQDFTTIELKLIYNLSLFSERNVDAHAMGNIPFVFAGDPLQTLNPTGFRWEAVKSSFYDYLIAPIARRNNNHQNTLNYKELVYNYRSSKNIVDFCNIIQLLRLCLFGNSYQIKPQLTWFISEGMTPFVYSKQEPKAQQLLEHEALVIIPNCHESEESQYVQDDPILKKSVSCDETGVPLTVLSPSSAKGLEFNEIVVLYCFGATCPKSLLDRLQGNTTKIPDRRQLVKWEYFLNRLYVAISRAKKRLIILDDNKGLKNFWKVIQDVDAEKLAKNLGAQINSEKWQGDKLLAPKPGTERDMDNILQGRKSDNLEEMAEKYYAEGLERQSPRLLRRARQLYQRLKMNKEALQCYAPLLEFEKDYSKAAENYLKINDPETALRCVWYNADFDFIVNADWKNYSDLRITVAHQLKLQDKKSPKWKGHLDATSHILKQFTNNKLLIFALSEGGKQSLTALFNWFYQEYEQGLRLDEQRIWKILSELRKGIEYKTERFAVIAYKLKRYKNALLLWEEAGKTGHKLYYQCQYHDSSWPHSLLPLKQMQDFNTIITQWQDRGKNIDILEEKYQTIVIEAMIRTNKQVMAAHLLQNKSIITPPKLRKNLYDLLLQRINAVQQHSSTLATNTLSHHLEILIATQSWKNIPPFLNKTDNLNKIKHPLLDQKLIEFLAYSTDLNHAPLIERELIFHLLQQRFYQKDKQIQWLPVAERGIAIAMMGIVIERIQYYQDAKEYYFWITRYAHLSNAARGYFDQRIAVCLQKEADHRATEGLRTEREESKIRDLKKKLGIDYIDPDVAPGHYPDNEVLSDFDMKKMRERLRPPSTAESKAKEKIRHYGKQGKEKKWLDSIESYTKLLANNEKWDLLATEWCHSTKINKYYPKSTRRQRQQALEAVIKAIMNTLSHSDSILESSGGNKMKFSNLFVDQLKNKAEGTWSNCDRLELNRQLIGSCLERVAKHEETIDFYQWGLNDAENESDEKLMAERLIVAKERYANFISRQHQKQTLRKEAYKLRNDYQLHDKELPEYPCIEQK